MPPKKRRSLSDALADVFNPVPRVTPADQFTEPTAPRQPGLHEGGFNYNHPEVRRTRELHAKVEPVNRSTRIPVGGGRAMYWNEFTPRALIDRMKDDQLLKDYARGWMMPGGNDFDRYLYNDRLLVQYGLWEDPNLHPVNSNLPWSDWNHYFDWKSWKAEYNRLKG